MAQLDFYALRSDIETILEFVFEQTDCRVFESYSRPSHELREFSSLDSLRGSDFLEANHGRYFLRLLSKSINCEPIIREFTLTKTGQKRQEVNGPGMFQIDEGHRLDTQGDALSWSTFRHWNEAGAKQRSSFPDELLETVDWKRMRRISGQIQRHIRNKLAVAKIRTRPILPDAFRVLDESQFLWAGPGVVAKGSDRIEVYDR
ncbi:MAG: hypothetical protein AAF004_02745 [Pseudomonadota bacterium]